VEVLERVCAGLDWEGEGGGVLYTPIYGCDDWRDADARGGC